MLISVHFCILLSNRMKVVLVGASFTARTHQCRDGTPVYSSTFSSTETREENVRQKLEEAAKGGGGNGMPTYFAKSAVPGQMRRLST